MNENHEVNEEAVKGESGFDRWTKRKAHKAIGALIVALGIFIGVYSLVTAQNGSNPIINYIMKIFDMGEATVLKNSILSTVLGILSSLASYGGYLITIIIIGVFFDKKPESKEPDTNEENAVKPCKEEEANK